MNDREPTILTGWWDFAVRALSAVTAPADVDGCDRAVEDLARQSLVGRGLHRASEIMQAGWSSSRFRAAADACARILMSGPPAAHWRIGGWMLTVIGVTAVAVNPLSTYAPGPLTWIVPSVIAVFGLFVMALAAPLSRAAADRARRRR
jgi:hypothetical protein